MLNKTGWFIYYYVVIVGGIVLLWNEWGGEMIQNWYWEYVQETGHINGSGKWRVHRNFHSFTMFFGLWVYPLSYLSFIFLIWSFIKKKLSLQEFGFYLVFPAAILFFYMILGLDFAITRGNTWYEFLPLLMMYLSSSAFWEWITH